MATQRIGESSPVFGTIDEGYGIFENVELTTEVEETELMDGDMDVVAVDQHTKRIRCSGEFIRKSAGGIADTDVGSGALVVINGSDANIAFSGYIKTYTRAKSKGDYMKARFEATSWPELGS